MSRGRQVFLASLATLPATLPAAAHPNHVDGTTGLTGGIAHPFTGVDHLAAMLAVGLLAARLGGRWTVGLPSLFLAGIAAGGVAASAFGASAIGGVEQMIAA